MNVKNIYKFSYKIFYDFSSRSFVITNDFLALVTIISIAGIILETSSFFAPYKVAFRVVEYVTVFFFSLEYAGRLIANKKRPLKYIFSFFGVVDLLAMVPTFLGLTNLTFLKSVRMLRILRFLRMVRLAKIARIGRKKHDLKDLEDYSEIFKMNIQIYFFALLATVVALGSLIYIFESNQVGFSSIPRGMLWVLETLLGGSISGYVPQTTLGIAVGILARFAGLILFGLLIHVMGSVLKRFLLGDTKTKGNRSTAQ